MNRESIDPNIVKTEQRVASGYLGLVIPRLCMEERGPCQKRTLHRIWGFGLARRRVRCLRSNERIR